MASLSLSQKVAKFRQIARDILRMVEINKLVCSLNKVKLYLASVEGPIKVAQKEIDRTKYALTKLDEADPDYTKKKEHLEKDLADRESFLVEVTEKVEKDKVALNKELVELTAEITKWETGENKVSLESLNALSKDLIFGSAKTSLDSSDEDEDNDEDESTEEDEA